MVCDDNTMIVMNSLVDTIKPMVSLTLFNNEPHTSAIVKTVGIVRYSPPNEYKNLIQMEDGGTIKHAIHDMQVNKIKKAASCSVDFFAWVEGTFGISDGNGGTLLVKGGRHLAGCVEDGSNFLRLVVYVFLGGDGGGEGMKGLPAALTLSLEGTL